MVNVGNTKPILLLRLVIMSDPNFYFLVARVKIAVYCVSVILLIEFIFTALFLKYFLS